MEKGGKEKTSGKGEWLSLAKKGVGKVGDSVGKGFFVVICWDKRMCLRERRQNTTQGNNERVLEVCRGVGGDPGVLKEGIVELRERTHEACRRERKGENREIEVGERTGTLKRVCLVLKV